MIQMYDTWVQAVDKGELAGVCMLDMSAAFDVVDHGILLDKLKLYGFDGMAVQWMSNYLSGRSQLSALMELFHPSYQSML